MKKKWFSKWLCINLSLFIIMSNAAFSWMGNDFQYVYAAEVENEDSVETNIAEIAETKDTETIEIKDAEVKDTIAEEIKEEIPTNAAEIKDSETEKAETKDSETTETKTEAEKMEGTETEITEETEVSESEIEATETALEDNASENKYSSDIESLLEKLKQKYPDMYINDDGYFEYIDENGVVHTYDPYDPELCKYLLDDEVVLSEDNYSITQFNAGGTETTVSPFTNQKYYHESHLSDKIVRHGIDVSRYQGDIDWGKVKKAGATFAFIRIGYRGYGEAGKIAGDDYAKKNIQKAHDAGIKVGVYFFSQAISKPEASEEAEYCINFLNDNNLADYITLPVVIDYEYSSGSTKGRLENANLSRSAHQSICDRFVQDVYDVGYKGGIYANYQMLKNDMQPSSSSLYGKTQYWIARYNEATHYSDDYRFWQYSSKGKVDGISGNVDCNFWYEDKRDITKCRVSIKTENDFVTDYVDDVKEALSIYDTANKYELVEDKDYEVTVTSKTVSSETGDEIVKYDLLITGINEYMGKLERKDISMGQLALSEAMVGDIAVQEYTGFEITQETGLKLEINNGNSKLIEGEDYTVSYSNNINAGTGYVIVTGMGHYTGEVKKAFSITGMKLEAEMFDEIPDVIYTGINQTTDTGVIIKGTNNNSDYQLVEGKDYTLKYSANKNVGTAKVTVIGQGNYSGKLQLAFQIVQKDFSEIAVMSVGGTYDTYEMTYTGRALKPKVAVTVNGQKLSGSDYTLEYGDNIEVGTEAYVIVKGKKNYTGEVKKYFTIIPKAVKAVKLTSKMVSLEHTHMYAKEGGEPVTPELYVVSGTRLLEKDVDYTVSYQNKKGAQFTEIKDAGDYKIVVNGIGGYTGKVTKNFTLVSGTDRVLSDTLTEVTLVSEPVGLIYTGKAVTPQQVTVKDKLNDTTLVEGTDYRVSYVDNKTAGIARIVIKGKGLYKGEVTKTFEILPKNLEGTAAVSLNKDSYVYNGKKQQPKVKIKDEKTTLKEKRDFTITYSAAKVEENAKNCTNVDNYTVNIVFKGNYAGTAAISYEITPADFSKVKVNIKNQLYTGNDICLKIEDMTIKLGGAKLDEAALEGVTIGNWHDNTNVGKAGFQMVTTKECKNFISGNIKDISFKIVKKPVKNLEITVGGFAVSAKNKCDLKLVYNDGIEFNQSNGAEIIIKDADTGETLPENSYTVKFSNNKNAGNAKVKVSGVGGYSGSRTITFQIVGKPLNETCRIDLSNDSYIYNNSERKPSVTFYYGNTRLKNGSEYTVKYADNKNAGTAKVIVTGKGNYAGTMTKTFTITPKQKKDSSKITISSIGEQKYTGNVIVPNVKVTVDGITLTKGKDYTVSVLNSTRLTYSQNKQRRGIATVIITGVGNYQGTLAKTSFVVVEK